MNARDGVSQCVYAVHNSCPDVLLSVLLILRAACLHGSVWKKVDEFFAMLKCGMSEVAVM